MASAPAKTAPRPKAVLILAALAALAVTWLEAPWLVWLLAVAAVAVLVAVKGRKTARWWRQYAAARRRDQTQGEATWLEKRRKLSARAAAGRTRGLPADQAAVVVGTSGGQKVTVARFDGKLLLAPPRTWKTALLCDWINQAPGSLVASSSRGDLLEHTYEQRRKHGKVWILDADGYSGFATNFSWNMVSGCRNPNTAMRRAGELIGASPRDPTGRDRFHEDRGMRLIYCCMNAAAAVSGTMHHVDEWVDAALDSDEPYRILRTNPNAYIPFATELRGLLDCENPGGVVAAARAALGWMKDPVLAAVVNPPGSGAGEAFNPRRFLHEGTGSLYLIGVHRERGSFAPLFAAIVSELWDSARHVAERSPGRRLPRPHTMALDEIMTTVPVDAWLWAALAAGYGVELIAAVQAMSQMYARWGEQNARTYRECTPVTLIGGGFTDWQNLEAISKFCGPERDLDRDGREHPVFSPQRLHQLDPWHGLLLARGARPVEVKVTPVWDAPGYTPVVLPEAEPELDVDAAPLLPAPEVPAGLPDGDDIADGELEDKPRPEIEGKEAA